MLPYLCVYLVVQSCLTLETPWTVARQAPSVPGILQASILECHFLLQGIFLTHESNPGLCMAG